MPNHYKMIRYFDRRRFIKQALLLLAAGSGLRIQSSQAQTAWPEQAFARTSLQQTLTHLIGQTAPTESKKIILKAPEMAENGSVVPVTITTTLPDVQSIALLADKNPVPLVARFNFSPTVEPFVSTHIKMAESSNIITIVQSENNYFIALKWVEVTIGGCD